MTSGADVLIVGGVIAGLCCALRLDQEGLSLHSVCRPAAPAKPQDKGLSINVG